MDTYTHRIQISVYLNLLFCKRMFDSSFLTALLGSSQMTPRGVMSMPDEVSNSLNKVDMTSIDSEVRERSPLLYRNQKTGREGILLKH
jgi:hypothetical protein